MSSMKKSLNGLAVSMSLILCAYNTSYLQIYPFSVQLSTPHPPYHVSPSWHHVTIITSLISSASPHLADTLLFLPLASNLNTPYHPMPSHPLTQISSHPIPFHPTHHPNHIDTSSKQTLAPTPAFLHFACIHATRLPSLFQHHSVMASFLHSS